MSQNQSYFWQTTRHNVYLKRSAKLNMFLALMAVLTFSTICVAEVGPNFLDETAAAMEIPAKIAVDEAILVKDEQFDVVNNLPSSDPTKETKGNTGFLDAFTASISVILFTELGDKTFFIAAIMAMRHPRLIVFTGAITALALMTVLSVVFGMAATIIPKVYTYYISTALFAIFGLKMIYEGYFMKATDAQEEMEEVQSDLRKREDELYRSQRGGDSDAKRKNSNSDKEDAEIECGAGALTASPTGLATATNPEMQHRQRKQLNNSSNHNNINNNNNNGCELNKDNDDDDDATATAVDNSECDAFLTGEEVIKMSTFHSSPALSASALSNQTNQTNCDDDTSSNHKFRINSNNNNNNSGTPSKKVGDKILIHSASASAGIHTSPLNNQSNGKLVMAMTMNGKGNSIDSVNSLSLNSASGAGAAGQSNGELKQVGGSKKRLERDVSSALVQDPESGIVRKNSKKSAAYLTSRVLMQAFTMTFLAEWGDRSQLTTIILAASKDAYGVVVGGVIGHSICTGLAVIGGRMVAAKISVRTVTIVGGIVFLFFAAYALIVRPDDI